MWFDHINEFYIFMGQVKERGGWLRVDLQDGSVMVKDSESVLHIRVREPKFFCVQGLSR